MKKILKDLLVPISNDRGWIPIAAAAAGSLLGGWMNNRAQKERNKEAKREAHRNRVFQENMSNTSYTRAVQDMKNAGLNPSLAYGQGGASTPSGAVADIQTESALGDTMSNGAKKSIEVQTQVQNLDNMRASELNTKMNTQLNEAQTAQTVNSAERLRLSNELQQRENRILKDNPTIHKAKILGQALSPAINSATSAIGGASAIGIGSKLLNRGLK